MLKRIPIGIAIGIMGFLWYVSPIFKPFPQPTGLYSIGTLSLQMIDNQRNDPYDPENKKRAIIVRIWYPSSQKAGEKYSYLGSKMPFIQKMFADYHNLPYWLTALLWCNIKTHAYENALLTSTRTEYPIVIFSHGLLGTPSDMYVALIENLVSHGYIVVGIDHPHFNLITQYPDGSIVSSHNVSTQFQTMSQDEQRAFLTKAIETYKADMRLVIDELEILNRDKNSIFYHRFDVNKIGVMGHSAGGTAAIEFCRSNNRCKTAVDLDGWYDHIIGYEPLKQPVLLLFGAKSIEITEPTPEYLTRKEITREQYYQREQKIAEHKKALCQAPDCSMIIIPEATHGDFGDDVLLKWPLRSWYAPDSYKLLETINGHILHFLAQHLK